MFKPLALTSFILFAFMAGVIFGAKKQTVDHQAYKNIPRIKQPTQLKIEAQKEKITKKSNNKTRKGFTVVLATFRQKESALKHVKNISIKGFKAFYFAKKINEKTWHRVGIGSFTQRDEAESLRKELSQKKFANGSLVSEIPNNNQ